MATIHQLTHGAAGVYNLRSLPLELTTFEPVRLFVIIIIVFVLSACGSSLKNLVREGTAKVDTTSSSDVHFNRVYVYESDTGLLVRGELHKRSHRRGPIPGHLYIEITAPDGTILATTRTNYHRGSIKSRTSRFSAEIPIDVPRNFAVQIMHHQSKSGTTY